MRTGEFVLDFLLNSSILLSSVVQWVRLQTHCSRITGSILCLEYCLFEDSYVLHVGFLWVL